MIDKTAVFTYLGTFLALAGAGVGVPIPEELPVVIAGALVGHDADEIPPPPAYGVATLSVPPLAPFPGNLPWLALAPNEAFYTIRPRNLRWWIMLPVCILGVVISDGLLYGLGRFWGPRLLEKPWMQRLVPPDKRARIEGNFQKYGVVVLLFARFLPSIRSPIFIMAGVTRVRFSRFLLADGLYAIPGVSLLFFLAFWFGDQFRDLVVRAEGKVEKLRPLLILLALTAIGTYLFYHFVHHPVATGDPREEMPIVGERIASKITHLTEPAGPTGDAAKDPAPPPS